MTERIVLDGLTPGTSPPAIWEWMDKQEAAQRERVKASRRERRSAYLDAEIRKHCRIIRERGFLLHGDPTKVFDGDDPGRFGDRVGSTLRALAQQETDR